MKSVTLKAGTLVNSIDVTGYDITLLWDTKAEWDGYYYYFTEKPYPPRKWEWRGYRPL